MNADLQKVTNVKRSVELQRLVSEHDAAKIEEVIYTNAASKSDETRAAYLSQCIASGGCKREFSIRIQLGLPPIHMRPMRAWETLITKSGDPTLKLPPSITRRLETPAALYRICEERGLNPLKDQSEAYYTLLLT